MSPQIPATSIMQSGEFKDAKSFRIACECHSPDHQVEMWIELDNDRQSKNLTISFYITATTVFWKEGFSRLRAAWDILINGYREEGHTLILSEQAAMNLAESMTKTINDLNKGK